MTKADELWEKYKQPGKFDGFTGDIVCKLDFLAALKEYGQAVRAEDVRICREDISGNEPSGHSGRFGALDCAAAIENTPLP